MAAKKPRGRAQQAPLEKKVPAKRAAKASGKLASAKKTAAKKRPTANAPASKAPAASAGQTKKTVDAYVGALPPAQKNAATAIRALVREEAPGASESIKWGQPVYEQGGPFAFMKAAKAHLTFGFWRGSELADPDGLLQGAGDRMRHLKIVGSAAPLQAIRTFVKQAVALNGERGDPTRRG
jgi:hypothetical protein